MTARRRSADLPTEQLSRIEQAANRIPAAAISAAPTTALAVVHEKGRITADVTVASRLPGVSGVKGTIRRLVGWYVRDIAQQVNAFAVAVLGLGRSVTAALARVGQKLDEVDTEIDDLRQRVARLEGEPSAPAAPGGQSEQRPPDEQGESA